jgi:type IV pilus biogenesis protein CpaD/CtpE
MDGVRRLVVVFAILLVAGCATGGQTTTRSSPSSVATPPSTTSPPSTADTPARDATRGRFINTTSWSLRVWIDEQPTAAASVVAVTLKPGETVSWTLAQGPHRVVAHAYAVAPPSDTVVARFDRTIALDPKRVDGWFLRFREADFR